MKVCFVVMGFGKKTDYESGRTLDLNATYETIIHPAVTGCGLRCIRADEITQSGLIDVKMFDMLLRADLVIADISTGNVNAVYELGVRHALRPNSTIIMIEDQGRLHFDLNHVSTFHYSHFGDDIMAREAQRAVKALGDIISAVMTAPAVDSPVYTFLPKLLCPRMSDEEYEDLLGEAEASQQRLFRLMSEGERFARQSDHKAASERFELARQMKPGEPDILQKLALHIYKAKLPDEGSALHAGFQVLSELDPDNSNDPETLGIAGAISKRLWHLQGSQASLEAAIKYYRRGFEIRRSYYSGENLALCFEHRGAIQADDSEKIYDFMSAHKIRQFILKMLIPLVDSDDFYDRPDRRWIFATIANCYFATEEHERGGEFEQRFLGAAEAQWEKGTYEKAKAEMMEYRNLRLKLLHS